MNWVIKRKLHCPLSTLGEILVLSVELVMILTAVRLLILILRTGNADWYQAALMLEMESDTLFQEKSDAILGIFELVIVIVIVFCVISLVMFCRYRIRQMNREIQIFYLCGYRRNKIHGYLTSYFLLDGILSLPLICLGAVTVWNLLLQKEEIAIIIMAGM